MEQVQHYNKQDAASGLKQAEVSKTMSLASRLRAAGSTDLGLDHQSLKINVPDDAQEDLRALNHLIAKFAPDNFHWTLVELRTESPYTALPDGQYALHFGRTATGTFTATLANRCPPGLKDGGRAVSGVPQISAIVRSHLAQLGFCLGQRGMARTRHAGQYAPRLCAAWACVLQAAATGATPAALQRRLSLSAEAAREAEEIAARAGESLAQGPPPRKIC